MQKVRTQQVTILAGTSLSNVSADIGNEQLVGIELPAGWDAAAVSFQTTGSNDPTAVGDAFTSTELSFPATAAAANRRLMLDIHTTFGIRYVKVRSGLTAAAVNQTADRVITLLTRDTGA